MLMKEIIAAYDVLDSSFVTGEEVKKYLLGIKADANVEVYELVGPKGSTDMLKVRIPGKNGKTNGGDAPTAIYTTVNSNTTGNDNHVKWLGETATYGDSNVDVSDNTVVLSFEELENAKDVK